MQSTVGKVDEWWEVVLGGTLVYAELKYEGIVVVEVCHFQSCSFDSVCSSREYMVAEQGTPYQAAYQLC